jgi:hypothetical protein
MTDQQTADQYAGKGKPLSWADLDRLQTDGDKLTFDGRQVLVENRLRLSLWQGIATATVAIGAASQGALALFDFGCRMALWAAGCPK